MNAQTVTFYAFAAILVFAALRVITNRNAVHSALWLAQTMLCLGAMYMVQQAPFLGFVQIIVYTGAIMMLFLFVLMLVGKESVDSVVEVLRGQRVAAALGGIGLAVLLVAVLGRAVTGVTSAGLVRANTAGGGNVANLGRILYTAYLFPFELTSALLIIAAVGAMVLAHLEREEPKRSQKEIARERIRSGRPQPLPGPGVLSSGNSIGTPALLPDGSISIESVMASTPGVRELPALDNPDKIR